MNDKEDEKTGLDEDGEKEALQRLLVWAFNRLEELEALEPAEHVANAITALKASK